MICKKCEVDKPAEDFYRSKNTKSGYRGSCKACINKQNNEWYQNNIDSRRESIREYGREHPKENAARMRQWREDNPERVREDSRQRYLKNRESILEGSRKNHAAKPGYAGWKRARRKERIENNGGTFSMSELTALFEKYDNRCINPDCDGRNTKLTVDHVIPLALGGSNSIENIQPLCLTCNLRKGTQTIDYRRNNGSEV